MWTTKDIGAGIKPLAAIAGTTVDSEVSGAWVDRQGYFSVELALAIQAVLADSETIAIVANWQDADDSSGTGAADFGTALTSTTLQTGSSASEVVTGLDEGSAEFKQDLTAAKRWIRVQFTLTTSSTGTATYGACYILGGADVLPAA